MKQVIIKTSGLFSLIIIFALLAFKAASPVTIKGKIEGLSSTGYIYLYESLGTEVLKIDSVKHNKGEFSFRSKKGFPRGFYKIGVSEEESFMLILSNENITVSADAAQLPTSARISGSKENEGYAKLKKFNDNLNVQYQQLNSDAQKLQPLATQKPEEYNAKIVKLQAMADSLGNAKNKFYSQIQNDYKGLFLEKFAFMFSNDVVEKERFFTTADFTDSELARGDMIASKIAIYMQRFVKQDLESWKVESDLLLSKASASNSNKEVIYITIIRNMVNSDVDYARSLAKKYLKEFPDSKTAQYFINVIPKGPPAIGEPAPDIALTNPDGEIIKLSSLRGKVVLLDFWASWCGPCRRENPNVVKAYQKYKDKGFTVFSVSLDNEKERWLKAIQADNLVWESHVSDLKGWQSSPAKEYGVRGIPSTYLLDKEGKIIASNLRGEALEQMLEKLLK